MQCHQHRVTKQLRTSKNDTVRELHLYLAPDLQLPSSPIAAALPEITRRLTENLSELHVLAQADCPIPGITRFKRHTKARWDSAAKRFVPLEVPLWDWEAVILVVLGVDDLIDKIMGGGDLLLDWARDVRSATGLSKKDTLMVMIKGLNGYHAKTKTLKNREFATAARAALDGRLVQVQDSIGRLEKEVIEQAMLRLQLEEGCFLVHGTSHAKMTFRLADAAVEKTEDVEDWMYNLTADIAIKPVRLLIEK